MELPRRKYTVEEYLELDAFGEARVEYINGEINALAGSSKRHNNLSHRLKTLFDRDLPKGCESSQEQIRTEYKPDSTYTYPDVVVSCHPDDLADPYYVRHPWIIVEVLSESTRSYDQITKKHYYLRIPSLEHYLLIHTDEHKVEHHFKDGEDWAYKVYNGEAVIRLSEELSLSLQELYA